MAYCQQCGSALGMQAKFCGSCGASIESRAGSMATATPPFHAPPVPPAYDPSDEVLFIGQNADYYRNKWKASEHGSGLSWNWMSFILGLSWMAYRKMWLYAIIVLAGIMLLGFIEYLLNVPEAFSWLTTFAIWLAFGLFGNHAYQKHVREKVRLIVATNPPDRVAAELSRQGGTNLWGAVAFTVGLVFVIILEMLFYEALYY